MRKLAFISVLMFFLVSLVSGFSVPYEGQTFVLNTNSEIVCEDGSDFTDEWDTLYKYESVDDESVLAEDRDNDVSYTIDLETRNVEPVDADEEEVPEQSSHWIDVEELDSGDTGTINEVDFTVHSTSDTVTVDNFVDVEAYRLSATYEEDFAEDLQLETRYDTAMIEETAWYDSYSGMLLKIETEASIEFWYELYQDYILCDVKDELQIEDTGLDSNDDGASDLTKVLEERENPLKVEKELNLDVSETEIKQYEEIDVEVIVNGETTEGEIFLDDQELEETEETTIQLEEPGDKVLEVRKDQEEIDNLIYDYEADSVTIDVEELTLIESISRTLSNLF